MKGCSECNKWKQKHDHAFGELSRSTERIATLLELVREQHEALERLVSASETTSTTFAMQAAQPLDSARAAIAKHNMMEKGDD